MTAMVPSGLNAVFAVPPLARKSGAKRAIDFDQNSLIVGHIINGGITRLIYGGNAFLYHVSLAEYEQLLDWLSDLDRNVWIIPSIGPSYGRAIDQAPLLRRYQFPCAMVLPSRDPRDALGLELGYREVSEAAVARLIVYFMDEINLASNREAALNAASLLIGDGVSMT